MQTPVEVSVSDRDRVRLRMLEMFESCPHREVTFLFVIAKEQPALHYPTLPYTTHHFPSRSFLAS